MGTCAACGRDDAVHRVEAHPVTGIAYCVSAPLPGHSPAGCVEYTVEGQRALVRAVPVETLEDAEYLGAWSYETASGWMLNDEDVPLDVRRRAREAAPLAWRVEQQIQGIWRIFGVSRDPVDAHEHIQAARRERLPIRVTRGIHTLQPIDLYEIEAAHHERSALATTDPTALAVLLEGRAHQLSSARYVCEETRRRAHSVAERLRVLSQLLVPGRVDVA